MSDLDKKEQDHVRAAMRYLHRRLGTFQLAADALRCSVSTFNSTINGRASISASMALRVARLCNVMIDDLLVGRFLPAGACPNCGHVITSDFKDENTIVEHDARQPALAVVK